MMVAVRLSDYRVAYSAAHALVGGWPLAVRAAYSLRDLVEAGLRSPHPREIEINTGLDQGCKR
jgi:hypothetical protein